MFQVTTRIGSEKFSRRRGRVFTENDLDGSSTCESHEEALNDPRVLPRPRRDPLGWGVRLKRDLWEGAWYAAAQGHLPKERPAEVYNHNVVYVLGAGASVDAGMPVVADFLHRMRDSLEWLEGENRHLEAKAIRQVL